MCVKQKKVKLTNIKKQLKEAINTGNIDEINRLSADARKIECEISDDIIHSKNREKWFYNR